MQDNGTDRSFLKVAKKKKKKKSIEKRPGKTSCCSFRTDKTERESTDRIINVTFDSFDSFYEYRCLLVKNCFVSCNVAICCLACK